MSKGNIVSLYRSETTSDEALHWYKKKFEQRLPILCLLHEDNSDHIFECAVTLCFGQFLLQESLHTLLSAVWYAALSKIFARTLLLETVLFSLSNCTHDMTKTLFRSFTLLVWINLCSILVRVRYKSNHLLSV